MSTPLPRLQLWKEEAAIISAIAAEVPDGGTIVEIGTAEGGTARLMHEACAGRGVALFTVDLAPSRIAVEHLAGTGVHIAPMASEAFARGWADGAHRPIDFLFIDGNHDLQHVVSDWNVWLPHLRPGACVVFHDFDPPRRGGLAHFAVRICGDTILRRGLLRGATHDYKLLKGRVDDPAGSAITADQCRETLVAIAEEIASLQEARVADIGVGTDRRLAAVLRLALTPGEGSGRVLWHSPHDGSAPMAPAARRLDSVSLCYLLDRALARDYAGLAELAAVHAEFLVWGEAIQMLHHGWTGPALPAAVPAAGASLAELSSFVAREQVRLVLLSRLLALCVDWRP